jgi:hypothetical protein
MTPAATASRLPRLLALTLPALAAAFLACPALADDRLHQSNVIWKAIDGCAREAAKAYPDYTTDSLAKREVERRLCLRRSNLPGSDGPPEPPVASSAGEAGK